MKAESEEFVQPRSAHNVPPAIFQNAWRLSRLSSPSQASASGVRNKEGKIGLPGGYVPKLLVFLLEHRGPNEFPETNLLLGKKKSKRSLEQKGQVL